MAWFKSLFGKRQQLSGLSEPLEHASGSEYVLPPAWTELFTEPVELVSMTTAAKEDISAMIGELANDEKAHFSGSGTFRRDPDRPRSAASDLAVWVHDLRLGYLSHYLAVDERTSLIEGESVDFELFVVQTVNGIRGRAWIRLPDSSVDFPFSPTNFPPLTLVERSGLRAAETTSMLNQRLASEGPLGLDTVTRGAPEGVHYLQTIEIIRQLKRDKRYEEALHWAMVGVRGAEAEAESNLVDGRIAPAYTMEAAIILRKMGRRSEEIEVLKRWLSRAPETQAQGSKIEERLRKIEETK